MAVNEKLAPQPTDTQLAGRWTRLGPGLGSSFPLQGMAFLSATPPFPALGQRCKEPLLHGQRARGYVLMQVPPSLKCPAFLSVRRVNRFEPLGVT